MWSDRRSALEINRKDGSEGGRGDEPDGEAEQSGKALAAGPRFGVPPPWRVSVSVEHRVVPEKFATRGYSARGGPVTRLRPAATETQHRLRNLNQCIR